MFGQKLDRPWTAILFVLMWWPTLGTSAPVMFARFSMDRPTLYAGEAFQLTLAIHSSGEILDKQINIANLPAPTDIQLLAFQELPNETVNIEGRAYDVRKFRTWARAPRAGTLTLAPQLNGTLVQTTRSFFMLQESRRPVTIPVEPFPLTLLPVPLTGKPAAFSGLVGTFDFSVRAEPLDIAPGDLITLTFTIRGDWLPDTFSAPRIKAGQGLKVYDLKPIPEEASPGKRVYQQTVVPESPSITELPACALIYFDPRTATYTTITRGPFPIQHHAEHSVTHAIYTPPHLATGTSTQAHITTPAPKAPQNWWESVRRYLSSKQERVVTGDTDIVVRLAPSDASQALFSLNPDTVVTEEETQEDWIRISCLKGIGWIPKRSIK